MEEEFIDRGQHLAPKQVKAYAEARNRRNKVAYNNGTISIEDATPLGYIHARQWIEDWHYKAGQRLRTLRDCALGFMDGRVFNGVSSGGPEQGIDAFTRYVRIQRDLLKWQWNLVEGICIPNGTDRFGNDHYRIGKRELPALAARLLPNLKNAFDDLAKALDEKPRSV